MRSGRRALRGRGPGAVWGRLAGASLRPGEASAAGLPGAEAESAGGAEAVLTCSRGNTAAAAVGAETMPDDRRADGLVGAGVGEQETPSGRAAIKELGQESSLEAGFAILLAEFLEGEGGFADAGLGGFVVDLVDVLLDCSDLLLDFSDNCFHCVVY